MTLCHFSSVLVSVWFPPMWNGGRNQNETQTNTKSNPARKLSLDAGLAPKDLGSRVRGRCCTISCFRRLHASQSEQFHGICGISPRLPSRPVPASGPLGFRVADVPSVMHNLRATGDMPTNELWITVGRFPGPGSAGWLDRCIWPRASAGECRAPTAHLIIW
jgi:hypothetical protein